MLLLAVLWFVDIIWLYDVCAMCRSLGLSLARLRVSENYNDVQQQRSEAAPHTACGARTHQHSRLPRTTVTIEQQLQT